MAASPNQKLKLLYIHKMLVEQTDAEHGLTMTQILQGLADVGINAERKSIYRDLDVLRDFGLTINTIQRMPVEYTLERTGLTFAELTLLADAAQSSKFLAQRTSSRLVNKLRDMAGIRQRDQFDKRVHVKGRIKSQNESVFYNVDTIHEALRLKRKIKFCYYKRDNRMQRQIQHDGKPYEHTPVRIVFCDGFYYLITWSDTHEDFVRFRIDRMRLVQVSDEKATRNAKIANYDGEDFAYQAFGMFDGKPVQTKLHVLPDAMDIIYDRFGDDVIVHAQEDGSADVHVTVRTSPQFFGWVAGMDGAVTLAGPETLVGEYRAWLKRLAEQA